MVKILVVEDELIVAEDIQRSLKDSGYTVTVVPTGEEALTVEEVDLVLMDIVLKGTLNGIQTARAMHQAGTPVVFLTAHADEETLNKAKAAEPYGYLVKPFEDTELHATIEMALYRHKLEKKVKETQEWLEKKVEERSRRIEILLKTKQRLQKEKDWKRGLEIISACVRKLGFDICGIFLVNPVRETLEYQFGKGISAEGPVSLRDSEYIGVRCILEKETIHVREYKPEEGKRMGEGDSFAWVPIVVQNEVFAAVMAGGGKGYIVTEEDVKDLEILAGMSGMFIDRTRLLIEPVPEGTLKTEVKHWLEPAEGYIVLEKGHEKAFEIFVDLVTHGVPGFVISRVYPEKLRSQYGLVKTPMLWLSRFEKEDAVSPDSFSKLVYAIREFTRRCGESVILLDGLEYLITQAGFDTVLTYVEDLKDIAVVSNSRLVIPLHKEAISAKEYSMLEKEFKVVPS